MNPSTSQEPAVQNHQVLGACPHDCPDTCSLLTTVQDGVAIRVQGNPAHPHTAGALCTKVSRYTERSYHAQRLLHPLKRVGPKGSGQFERVGWDEALRDIAGRLMQIAARDARAEDCSMRWNTAPGERNGGGCRSSASPNMAAASPPGVLALNKVRPPRRVARRIGSPRSLR